MDNTIDNQLERSCDIHWLIGIIEGEGCFTLNTKPLYGKLKKSYFPTIQITNTNIGMIKEIKRILSNCNIGCYFHSYLPLAKKPYYRIEIGGIKRVKKFFDIFGDSFRCRTEQAMKLKEYVELRLSKPPHSPITEKEHKIAEELYVLNGSHKNNSLSNSG